MINLDWDDQRIAMLKRMRAEGATYSEMGAALGCSRSSIGGKIARLGVPRSSGYEHAPKWTREEDAKLRALFDDGLTLDQIGEALDRSRCGIEHRAHKLGWTRRRVARQPSMPGNAPSIREVKRAMARLPVSGEQPKNPKSFFDIEPHDCRWVLNDGRPEDFLFCADPTADSRLPYCALHCRIAGQGYARAREAT